MAKIKKRTWTNRSGTHTAWQLDFTDRHGKRHREQFTLKRDAEDRLAELQGSTRAGTYRPLADKEDVAAACADFLSHMATRHERGERVTDTYLRTCRQHCQNYIDPKGKYAETTGQVKFDGGLGSIKLADLTAARVIRFRDDMRQHGAGIVTTRRVLGTLSRILKHAVERDMATVNVAKGVRVIGRRDEDNERVTPPSKKDIAALLSAANKHAHLRVKFAAATGLRASEQWALRWKHVDLDAGRVNVRQRVDAFGNIDTTKSAAGQRSVPIGAHLAEELAAYREDASEEDFVFPDARGGFTRHTNFTKRVWNPLVKKAGIEHTGWHSLRHFAVSTWIAAGLQPKAVQTLAGHATYAITMNRYGHLFPDDDHAATFDAIAEALGT